MSETPTKEQKKYIAAILFADILRLSGSPVEMDYERLNTKKLEEFKDKVIKIQYKDLMPFFETVLLLDPDHALAKKIATTCGINPNSMRDQNKILDEAYFRSVLLIMNDVIDTNTFKNFMIGIITVNPFHYDAQTRLVKILCRHGHPEEAEFMVEKLLQTDPGSTRAMILAGDFFRYKGDTLSAYEWSNRAIKKAQESRDEELIERAFESRDAIARDIRRGKCPPLDAGQPPSSDLS